MKKVKILCSFIIFIGIGLFVSTYTFISAKSIIFGWCIGLACALIILGSGFLVNSIYSSVDSTSANSIKSVDLGKEFSKEKSGYLVCKLMNILLCIYILLLEHYNADQTLILLSIALLVIQYLLNLLLYVHFSRNKDN